ncbi:MAG: DNA cytosine methyltransferase [Planctomycetales bacterium]|nr:DNA cytosine methyltransferase [Planctomycetales bacterium]
MSYAASSIGCSVVGGLDLSESALQSFRRNFPNATSLQASVRSQPAIASCDGMLRSAADGKKNLVVSGPPCQGFSVAGARVRGDTRNRVLLSVASAIARLKPDAALIENVAALLADRHKSHLQRFKKKLEDAGFHLVILQLNAADFGAPQIRHRMICLAAQRPLSETRIKATLESLKAPPISVRKAFAGLRRPPVYNGGKSSQNSLVPNHIAMRHSESVQKKIAALVPGTGPMSYRRLHPDRPSRTLISGNRAPPAHFSQPRSITVREAARLQGFPDDFMIVDTFSNQMLHVTNAVPLPLARAALIALLGGLEEKNGRE